MQILPYDKACAMLYGKIQGMLNRAGMRRSEIDLMIACVALTNDLTLVTHNTADFQNIPNLRIEDWIEN